MNFIFLVWDTLVSAFRGAGALIDTIFHDPVYHSFKYDGKEWDVIEFDGETVESSKRLTLRRLDHQQKSFLHWRWIQPIWIVVTIKKPVRTGNVIRIY